jgi:hypothetical protein
MKKGGVVFLLLLFPALPLGPGRREITVYNGSTAGGVTDLRPGSAETVSRNWASRWWW